MDIWGVFKLAGFVLLIVFVLFAFRQGRKVKRDKDAPDNWGTSGGQGGGPGDGPSEHPS